MGSVQQSTISGTVKDADGEPLPGVTVVVKGTTQGTSTNIDGEFTLTGVPADAVLLISFVGMKTQEITVGDQTSFNVVLEADAIGLEEVVAIGYTVRKKGEVTGSVATVSSETLERTASKDVAKSLSGKVPGLIVNDRGGYPGDNDMTLLIRGKSTLNNNAPLILIDGITAGTSGMANLSPEDIESLTVLKDGAAAIYGARAANGVILVTTKRGKSGAPKFKLSTSYSMSTFAVKPKLMSSEQFAIYNNEIAARQGSQLPYSQEDIAKYASGEDPINFPNTDWQDLTFADYSPEARVTFSVSGGSDNVKYFVSGDYMNQTGLYDSGDLNFEQYQVRSNLDIKLHEKLSVGIDLSGRFGKRNQPGVNESYIYKHIYVNFPTEVGIYPNGLPAWGGENGSNPVIMSSDEAGFVKTTDNDLRSKFSFDWNLDGVTEGLRMKGFAGIRKMSNDVKSWYTPWTVYQYDVSNDDYREVQGYSQDGNQRILRESFWKYDELMLNATVHYDRTFDDHTIRGFAGVEQFSSEQRNFWAERKDFPSPDHPELFAGGDDGQGSSGTSAEWGRVNYFGSLSYDYAKKYFIDLTLRHDGSSNFGDGNRFGTFPGVGLSWAIGNEKFMDWSDSWLNALKLRTSWAIMGNDRIASFQYLTRYNYGGATDAAQPNWYIFGTNGTRYNGYDPSTTPNPDITWETADMKNIGLSFMMFDNRLSGDVNYFYQKREDILITRNASIPDVAGVTLPQENLGKVDNYGWELQLGWNDKIGEVNYNFGVNFTQAKNEVVYLDEAADVPEWRKREGHPMDSYIVYPTFGLFQSEDEVNSMTAKIPGTVAGEPAYVDVDGNGKIDANDRVRSYTSNVPEIQYGIFGGVEFKNINLNFLFQGQAKAQTIVYFESHGARPDFLFTERWTPENPTAKYPRAFVAGDGYSANLGTPDNFQGADLWLHDASFVRLKELELGYTLSKEVIGFGDLKLFVRGNNLLTMFSDIYDLGFDPESSEIIDFRGSRYPAMKTYSVGLNLNF
ncbi:TonB-dependent receptor [uncultured Draconibacterium sp.]|uniref:SusC/RagA family TonB-linked outer membrane protein n=1 Tax=uncultured Draconibacterium sp. TaxID=1573823 RepID=UPI0025CEE4E8|nr:TonB-dependent receptor [uncultured Draconibacterium sp.]